MPDTINLMPEYRISAVITYETGRIDDEVYSLISIVDEGTKPDSLAKGRCKVRGIRGWHMTRIVELTECECD